jgi:hypothetical protein
VQQASPTFTVEEFEYVEAGPGLALLRLAGVWATEEPDGDVALVADVRGERLTLSALPAPQVARGSWRAAYSAPPELLRDEGARFELEPAGVAPIELPRPLAHSAAAPAGPPEPDPVSDPEPAPRQEAAKPAPAPAPVGEQRAASRIFGRRRQPLAPAVPQSHAALGEAFAAERHARQAAERTAAEERARAQRAEAVLAEELRSTVGKTEELIARIDGYEHSRVSFEEELDAVRRTHADLLAETEDEHDQEARALRGQLHDLQQQLAAAHEELESANDHVDTLHEAHSLELGAARSQRDAAEQRQAGLEQQLAEARAAAEALGAQLEEREGLIARARQEAALGSAASADLHAAVARLRDAIAVRARDAASARRRFSRDPAMLDRSREELRRDAERIAALERQAEALRDAIHSQLPYSLHASPLQEALPLPEGGEAQTDA